jgi:hypothetical protein
MTKPYVQSGEPLHEFLHSFWQRQVDAAEQETPDYRHPPLPLARIKKVMKSDPDVKVPSLPLLSLGYNFTKAIQPDDRGGWFVLPLALPLVSLIVLYSAYPILQGL